MDIHFKATKYEPTPDILEQAERQGKALEKYLGAYVDSSRATFVLEKAVGGMQNGDIWRAELTVERNGELFRAESTKAKLDHAITTVTRDVGRELSRAHAKEKKLERKSGATKKGMLRGFFR